MKHLFRQGRTALRKTGLDWRIRAAELENPAGTEKRRDELRKWSGRASVKKISQLTLLAVFCLMVLDVSAAFAQLVLGSEYRVKAGFIYNFAKYVEWPCGTFKNDKTLRLCIVSDDPEADIFFSLNNKMIGKKKIRVRKEENLCFSDEHTHHRHPDPTKIFNTLRSLPSKIIPKLGKPHGKDDQNKEKGKDAPLWRTDQRYEAARKDMGDKIRQKDEACGCHILFIDSTDEKRIRERLGAVKNQSVLTVGQTEGFAKKMGGVINFFTEGKRLRFRVNIDAAKRAGLKFRAQLMMSAEVVREEP
ncbi:MAG: hypothetical protein B6245_05575 [Desulfobacteraceae bacterium 4572_88]|nr:MAG: hypothetical protein B6245_05575 [Desulfobacteraceae bacterium 4572_88]RLC13250.1 MAG: hypothetical protein DRI57_16610 [Deltaproteobacteria bacterium]